MWGTMVVSMSAKTAATVKDTKATVVVVMTNATAMAVKMKAPAMEMSLDRVSREKLGENMVKKGEGQEKTKNEWMERKGMVEKKNKRTTVAAMVVGSKTMAAMVG